MAKARPQTARVEPRCLNAPEMARYCHLTTNGVRSWVDRGLLPPPLPGTRRWDRKAVDAALDRLSGIQAEDESVEENDFDRWLRENGEG